MYLIVWSFKIKKELRKEFEQAYGARGTWVRFFKTGKGYIDTELLCDTEEEDRYVTIDRWTLKSAYEEFRMRHSQEYALMDKRLERLTEQEILLGSYERKE